MKLTVCCYSFLLSEVIKRVLEEESSMEVVTIQKDWDADKIAAFHPDLIIADLDTFFDHSEDLSNNGQSEVLIINNTARLPSCDGQLSEYISKGLVGILPTETDAVLLKRAVKAVSQGEIWINNKSIKKDMLMSGQQRVSLSKREGQIVYYICRGCRNKEIARNLDITEQTVKSHCNSIYKKFNVSNRLQLALIFMHDKSLEKTEEPLLQGILQG